MNSDLAVYWIQETLEAMVVLAGPVLIAALVVGLGIAVFQAATTIQEMTLTYIPKMIAVVVVLFLLFGFLLEYAVDFMTRILEFLPNLG